MSITKETYSQAIKTRLPRLQQWEIDGLAQVLADLRDDRAMEAQPLAPERLEAFQQARGGLLTALHHAFPNAKAFGVVVTYSESDHDMFSLL